MPASRKRFTCCPSTTTRPAPSWRVNFPGFRFALSSSICGTPGWRTSAGIPWCCACSARPYGERAHCPGPARNCSSAPAEQWPGRMLAGASLGWSGRTKTIFCWRRGRYARPCCSAIARACTTRRGRNPRRDGRTLPISPSFRWRARPPRRSRHGCSGPKARAGSRTFTACPPNISGPGGWRAAWTTVYRTPAFSRRSRRAAACRRRCAECTPGWRVSLRSWPAAASPPIPMRCCATGRPGRWTWSGHARFSPR